jgi:hypothetical protein
MAEYPMTDHAEKLLHCVPRKILAKCLGPGHRILEKE